jgi:hypothetical protein
MNQYKLNKSEIEELKKELIKNNINNTFVFFYSQLDNVFCECFFGEKGGVIKVKKKTFIIVNDNFLTMLGFINCKNCINELMTESCRKDIFGVWEELSS